MQYQVTTSAADLGDLATLAAIASTDTARPILTAIRLVIESDGLITGTATDSYRLATMHREGVTTGDGGTVLVSAKSFKDAVKNAAKDGGKFGELVLSVDGDAVTVSKAGADSLRYPVEVIAGTYPNTDSLITSDAAYDAAEGVNRISLNPHYVASFAKVAPWTGTGSNVEAMTFRVMSKDRPVKCTSRDGRTVALLMPVRVS